MAWTEYETLHPVSDDPDIQRALDSCETVVLFRQHRGDERRGLSLPGSENGAIV